MQAIVQDHYGPPERLRLAEVDRPEPGEGEVLVRVRAASVHPDVWHVVTGTPFVLRLMGSGLRRPKCRIPGTDLAGVVEGVGAGVSAFRPGDHVFGESTRGFSWRNGGTFAEYVAAPAEVLAPMPASVSFEQAAAVPTAGYITLLNLPERQLGPGKRMLVNGAGGGVGALALQIAKAKGTRVTGVDHTSKLDLLRSLGADEVLDATDDFTSGPQRYDLIFDVPGNRPFAECRRVLAPDGTYVLIGHDLFGRQGRPVLGRSFPRVLGLGIRSLFQQELRAGGPGGLSKPEAIARLRAHLEAGEITPVIARAYPLAQAAQAMRHLAEDRPVGRVVVTP